MFENIKLKTKLLLFFPALFLLSFLVVGIMIFKNASSLSNDNILQLEFETVGLKQQQIKAFLMDRKSDVLFLSKIDALQRLLDASEVDERAEAKMALEKDFLALARSRGIYDQIRYLDESGQEIIRVDTEGGKSYVIEQKDLQNKGSRYYFTDTINLSPGEIFVSRLDLNIEREEIELPFAPMIRYSTPVFNSDGDLNGVVIINVKADYLLESMYNKDDVSIHLLVNQDGYYLYHYDKDKEWGFMLDNDETVYKDIPRLADQILSQNDGSFFDEQLYSYVSFVPVDLNNIYGDTQKLSNNVDDYWVVIGLKEKTNSLISSILSRMINVVIVIFFLFFITVLISVLIARSFNRRFVDLQKGIEIIKQGNLDYRLPDSHHDELGELSVDFNDMTKAIKQSRFDIDQKVEEQTKEIVNKQQALEEQQSAVLNILDDVEIERDNVLRERDKINAILHSIGDAVFVVDKALKIISYNKVAEKISGYTIKEAIGKPYKKILKFVFDETDKINDAFVKEAIATGEIQEMANHTMLIAKDGHKVPVADSAAPLKDKSGKVIGCVVVFRDVSREREIDKMKTEFVSLASHQLRTPLTAMRWSIEEIVGGELNDKEKNEYIHDTLNSVVRLSSLVNNLLNIARLETGRLNINPQPTNLVELTNQIMKRHGKMAKIKGVKMYLTKPKVALKKISLDVTLITEVISNLIDNAIKYSVVDKSGEDVKVKIETRGKDVVIGVSDNGIGIPKEDQKRIFEKFFRAGNAVKKQAEGNGLGLYIIKMIAEASGGKIWFESGEQGTTFYVSLPLAGSEARKGEKGLAGV